jgi:hypothetical protein
VLLEDSHFAAGASKQETGHNARRAAADYDQVIHS